MSFLFTPVALDEWIGVKVKEGQLSRCWEIWSTIVKVAQLCPTLCDPIDYTVLKFFRPEYWSEQPFPFPGDLPNPGIRPRSPTLQVDSLPAELPGKPLLQHSRRVNPHGRSSTKLSKIHFFAEISNEGS